MTDHLRITVGVNALGYLEAHARSTEDEMPAAMLVLYLNPTMPNAFDEYRRIATALQPWFADRVGDEIDQYAAGLDLTPDEEQQVQRDLAFVLFVNGVGEDVQTLSDDPD